MLLRIRIGPLIIGVLLSTPWAVFVHGATATSEIRFNRDIRPILSENCFKCHGSDKNSRKGKFRLDQRESAVEKGAIVPGSAEKSELIKRIFSSDAEEQMPPPDSHKKLSLEQKELLKKWIVQGALYEPHWAYLKPERRPTPQANQPGQASNAIDAFISRELATQHVQLAPEADRRTLVRRLHLDLIGLPPTPEEVNRFLAENDPGAYEREVDRLLASVHFGERMAVPWLDVVRFSDTVGYHGDQNQRIFPYRDYVIDSFNRNKPFDQFTIEQLAGDLLPNPTSEQKIATGFNRLNMMTREGGAQPKEYLAKYTADRVRTVSMAWLGSTMGCAECHDHKFDPFSAKDFYSMEAFFADIKQWGVYSDYGYTPNPDLKGWSNDHPFPPEVRVLSPYLRQREDRLRRQVQELSLSALGRARASEKFSAFKDWREDAEQFLKASSSGWETPMPEVEVTAKAKTTAQALGYSILPDQAVLFSAPAGVQTAKLKVPLRPGRTSMVRIELLPHAEHAGSILRDSAESTMLAIKPSILSGGKETRPRVYFAEADHNEARYINGFDELGVRDSWRTSAEHRQDKHTAVWIFDLPVETKEGDALVCDLGKAGVGCVRISVSPFANLEPLQDDLGARLSTAFGKKVEATKDDEEFLAQVFFLSTAADSATKSELRKLHLQWAECRDGQTWSMVTEARPPTTTRVLPRGNWQDETGAVVEPAVPHFLAQISKNPADRATRLDLARWLVSRDNPLTARTVANRLWKQFFGAGLCSTVDDLGLQGDTPSHPELLDWLAVEFMESGWNVKHLVKQIVLSATYRQSSNLRLALREFDPNNRLLASQNPRRLEAEFVRDNALSIAGLINLDVGGPSMHPYQPPGYYANLQFPDRDYVAEKDERQYRRGLYSHWQRTFLHPMMANFDAPGREECTAFRVVSNTPQQALTLLNDPAFTEAALALARTLVGGRASSDENRIDQAYARALARPPKPTERESLQQFLAGQRVQYQTNRAEATRLVSSGPGPRSKATDEVELAAWTQLCRVILNLHETITCY